MNLSHEAINDRAREGGGTRDQHGQRSTRRQRSARNGERPGFFALSAAQQQTKVGQALAAVQVNDAALLIELKTMLPHANLLVLGYHNSFNAGPTSPIGKLADPAIRALNALIAGEAKAFGDKYVDTYTPFLGLELA